MRPAAPSQQPSFLSQLASLGLSRRRVIFALQMPRSMTSEVLGGLAPMVVGSDRRLYCADAANRFDPYVFATHARRMAMPPEVLDRVFVSRAFTIHQLQAVVTDLLPATLRQTPPPMLALLGLDELFREESLPVAERRLVLHRIVGRLQQLPAEAKILVTYERAGTAGAWWRPMWELGDVQGRVESRADGSWTITMLRCSDGQNPSDVQQLSDGGNRIVEAVSTGIESGAAGGV